jgi:hypothetical protein
VFGGSDLKPETLVMSQPGLINNFNTTPVTLASDAIVMSISAEEVNTIRSFVQVAYGLIAFTTGGSFLINGGSPGAAIDANSPSIQPQVSQGANGLRPLRINYDVLYGQAKGNRIHNLAFAWQKQTYTGSDVSMLAAHLFDTYLTVDWAYAEEPYKIVWACRSDGRLLSLTYVPDQEVYAWCRHDTQGLFKSVCSVPEGNVDAVYVVVQRYVNGAWVYYLERMHERQGCCIYDAWFLDCALGLPKPTLNSPLYLQPTGAPGVLTAQTYAPGTPPSGDFGGRPPFPAFTGMLEFDTSAGGDGNGVAIPDWDHNPPRLFVSNAGSGACATYRLDATNTPPAQINFNAGTAVQGVSVGAVDSQGRFWLAGFGGIIRVNSNLAANQITAYGALSIGIPNDWFAAFVSGKDLLFGCNSNAAWILDLSGASPVLSGAASTVTEDVAVRVGRGNKNNPNKGWVLGTSGSSGGAFTKPAQPWGLYEATLVPGGTPAVQLVRKLSITPSMFGFSHFTAGVDMLGDEYDGNVMLWVSSAVLGAWSRCDDLQPVRLCSLGRARLREQGRR